MTKSNFQRNAFLAIPLYFASITPFVLLAAQLDLAIEMKYVGLGALGWWLALILRAPVILALRKSQQDMQTSSKYVIWASGPAEEIVRVILLLMLPITVDNAYSVGLGWGAIEVLYGLIQLFGFASLSTKNDAKAQEAREVMKQMGMDKVLNDSTPFWGALERVSAHALHLSFSLLLVLSPLLVLLTAPVHSLMNQFVITTNKKSVATSQNYLMGFSLALLAVTLLLTL